MPPLRFKAYLLVNQKIQQDMRPLFPPLASLVLNSFYKSTFQLSVVKPKPNQLFTNTIRQLSQPQTVVKPNPKKLSDYFQHSIENHTMMFERLIENQ